MTNQQIIDAIRNRGYPPAPYLGDAEITEAINGVLRDMLYEYLFETYGTFSTVGGQQIYDLFNTTVVPAISQGALAGGLYIRELLWLPIAGTGDSSVFGIAPWLQSLNIMPGAFQFSFRSPSDLLIFENNWGEFVKRFSAIDWEATTRTPGSPIRLFPTPIDVRTVVARYARRRTTAEIQQDDESWFLLFVESQCCKFIGRKLRMVAGTTMVDVKDSGARAQYWQEEGDAIEKRAWTAFHERNSNIGAAGGRS